jgi:hypothetical protein
MQLLKLFSFKGLWQSGVRFSPPVGHFRRFTNSFKDKTGRILPFGKGSSKGANKATISGSNSHWYTVASNYFKKNFVQVYFDTGFGGYYKYSDINNNEISIMQPYQNNVDVAFLGVPEQGGALTLDSANYSSAIVLNKHYVSQGSNRAKFVGSDAAIPVGDCIYGFDGLRVRPAGLPLPWNTITTSSDPADNHWVRTIYATIGLDGEAIFSAFLEQRATSATQTINLGQYSALTNYLNTRRADAVTGLDTHVNPTFRYPGDNLFGDGSLLIEHYKPYDTRFMQITGGMALVGSYPEITRGVSSTGLAVGDWLMLFVDADVGFPGLNGSLMMFQVRTLGTGGGQANFENNFKVLDFDTVSWRDANFSNLWGGWTTGQRNQFISVTADFGALANIFQILSYSTSRTAGYRVGKILPVCHFSTLTKASVNLGVPLSLNRPFMGVVTSFLSDWYDVTVGRTTFPPVWGITNYKELLVGHDDNAIYFSDVSLGGSTEMVSGASNLAPPGTEFGKITAICGAEDFMLVSRENKNYVLRGDIAGQFSITECDLPVEGAYNTRCCANYWGGKIVFMNRTGVYVVDPNGGVQEISAPIRDLFTGNNLDLNLFSKEIFKSAEQLQQSSTIDDIHYPRQDGGFFKIALDSERGFLLILTSLRRSFQDLIAFTDSQETLVTPNVLVFDMNDNSWYEWEVSDATSIEAYLSKAVSMGTDFYVEDGILRGSEKQILATQYMSMDAPSIEKQVNQLKMYGSFALSPSGAQGCKVLQQNDWKRLSEAKNTDTTYSPDELNQYAHKKRLTSSKPQATSIILESLDEGGIFLEAMEVEGVQIQEGVKR